MPTDPPKPVTPGVRIEETLSQPPAIPLKPGPPLPPGPIDRTRAYIARLEQSIQQGLQWVVFEPNGPALWARVRDTISNFLFNEWRSGSLLGTKPEEAYFVTCDRSTMTQNDLDNGRLICLVGVAPNMPAEFITFRITQQTADAKPPNP
jgi:phage tail sheath protein FI